MKRIALPLLSLLFLSGCLGAAKGKPFINSVHEGLSYSQVSYQKSLQAVADMRSAGTLSDDRFEKIMAVARKYQHTHNLILTTAQGYVTANEVEREGLEFRINSLNSSLSTILLEFFVLLKDFGVTIQ